MNTVPSSNLLKPYPKCGDQFSSRRELLLRLLAWLP
jgi:hypothetical protein